MISPFMQLEEERRRRDKELQAKIAGLGESMVAAPLNYQSLMQEAEARKAKIAKDAEELQFKRNEDRRSDEQNKLNQDKFDREKENDTLNRGQDIFDKQKKEKADKQGKAVKDVVSGGIGRNLEDQQILQESFDNPELADVKDQATIEGEIARQRFERDDKDRGFKIKEQDSATKKLREEARVAASRAKRGPKPRAIGDAALKRLEEMEIKLDDVARIKKYRDAVDTGLAQGLLVTLRQKVHVQNPQEALLDAANQQLINTELHRVSGATVTPPEFERVARAMGSLYDEEEVFEALLELVEDKAAAEYNAILKVQTGAGRDPGSLKPKGNKSEGNPQDNVATMMKALEALVD